MNYQLQQTGDQVQEILNQAPTTEQNLQSEITRSTTKDEQLETAIGNEKTRAEGVESNLQSAIGNEVTRAEGAESNLQTAIANEKTRAELIEGGLRTDVDAIKAEIPTQASPENQLADKAFVNSSIATNTAEFKGTYNSLEDLQTQVQDANANDYAFVVSTDAAGNTVYNRYKYVEGTGWVFEYALNNSSFTSAQWAAIQSGITAALVAKLVGLPTATELATQMNQIIASVTAEKTRAEGIESGLRTDVNANAAAIVAEKNRAEGVEGTLSTAIGTEKSRAEGAETILQQNIDAEALARGNADTTLQGEIDTINGKIPSQATASNQLADKAFVNSSIATNTADFKGTYNSLQELEAVTANNNDYGFVVSTDAAGNTVYNRYKYVEGTGWVFEYALNNSSFTSAQWAAIQSGITAALVTKLTNLPDNTALTAMFTAITSLIPSAASSDNKLVDYAQLVASLATKQDTLTFDDAPTQNSTNPVKSGGVYTAIATVTTALNLLDQSKQDKLTFDTYPTAGSDNPVKSKGIYEKLSEKQNTLTFDNTPTAGSDNPVKSQGIKSYVDAETTRAQNAESALSGRVTTAEGNITSLTGRMTTAEGDIETLQDLYNALQQSAPQVIQPTDTWPVANPSNTVIYRVIDRVNTPPEYYSDYMWNGTSMVLMATYNNAIDNEPTAGSNNLVKSGGVAAITDYLGVAQEKENISLNTGSFIRPSGEIGSLTEGYISSQIELAKGEKLLVENLFASDAFCVIAKYENSKYEPLIIGIGSGVWTTSNYEYVAKENITVVISGENSKTPKVSIVALSDGIVKEIREDVDGLGGLKKEETLAIGLNRSMLITPNGTPTASGSENYISDLIHLGKGEKIKISNLYASESYCVLGKWNQATSNYTPLLIGIGNDSYTLNDYEYIASEEMDVAISGEITYIPTIEKTFISEGVVSDIYKEPISLKIGYSLINDYFITQTGRKIYSTDTNSYITSPISLKKGQKIIAENIYASDSFCVISKYNNSVDVYAPIVLGVGSGVYTTNTYEFVAPDDMSIILSGDRTKTPVIHIENESDSIIHKLKGDVVNLQPLGSKMLYSFGDSLVDGNYNHLGMFDGLKDELLCYIKFAQNGAHIMESQDGYILQQIQNAPAGLPDLIGFDGLTNDAGGTVMEHLGTLSDNYNGGYDTTTFYGAFEQTIYALVTKYPYAKIFYVAPHNMPTRNATIQAKLQEIAKEVCAKWSIPVVDIYKEGQVNTCITSEQQLWSYSDVEHGLDSGTHLSFDGYKKFYQPLIKAKMLSII